MTQRRYVFHHFSGLSDKDRAGLEQCAAIGHAWPKAAMQRGDRMVRCESCGQPAHFLGNVQSMKEVESI